MVAKDFFLLTPLVLVSVMKRQSNDPCEMCSAEVSNLITIKVAGALLRVCPRCTSFGNVVAERPKTVSKPISKRTQIKPSRSSPPRRRVGSRPKQTDEELIDDYDRVIKSGRMKQKLSHEQLASKTGISVSSLKSMEAGKIRPTDRDARIIQRELRVSLFSALDIEPEFADRKKKKATTLGDIAVFRKFDDA